MDVPLRYFDGIALAVPRGNTPTSFPFLTLDVLSLLLSLFLLSSPMLLLRRRLLLSVLATLFFAAWNFLVVHGGRGTGLFAFIAGWKLSCTEMLIMGALNGRIEMVWLAAIRCVEGGRFGMANKWAISELKERKDSSRRTKYVFSRYKRKFGNGKDTFVQLI